MYYSNYDRKKLNMTPIRPVVTYCYETWRLSARDVKNLPVFEREALRKT
jgi:hypothetical protein